MDTEVLALASVDLIKQNLVLVNIGTRKSILTRLIEKLSPVMQRLVIEVYCNLLNSRNTRANN